MATQTRSRPRAKKETAAETEQTPDGVLVVKVVDEDGNILIDAQPVGNVQATEVLTILELAGHAFRAKIGLGVGGQPSR